MYYDPWKKEKLTEAVWKERVRARRRPLPQGHPTCFDFSRDWSPDEHEPEEDGPYGEGDEGWFGGRTPPASPNVGANVGQGSEAQAGVRGAAAAAGPSIAAGMPRSNYYGYGTGPAGQVGSSVGVNPYTIVGYGPNNVPIYQYMLASMMGNASNASGYGAGAAATIPTTGVDDLTVVRRFLRSVGVDESVLRGDLDALRWYVRGRMSR